jgi:hypothetical protein
VYGGCCTPYEKKDHAGATRAGFKNHELNATTRGGVSAAGSRCAGSG